MPRVYLPVLLLGIVAITAVCLGLRWRTLNLMAELPETALLQPAAALGAPAAGDQPAQPQAVHPIPALPAEAPAKPPVAKPPAARQRIDINIASAVQLESLPGVGPVLAQRIVDHRRRIGRFKSVEQLLDVEGIGPKKLADFRGLAYVAPAD